MTHVLILLAGGRGLRAGGEIPKQLQPLCGRPVLWWSMRAFLQADPLTKVILVMHPGLFDDWDVALSDLPEQERFSCELCCGGRDRTESVANALISLRRFMAERNLDPEDVAVAVHDAARPLVDPAMISRGWEAAERGVVAVPVVACASSLRMVLPDGGSEVLDRSLCREVQTPQIAMASDFAMAYGAGLPGPFTDDASLLQRAGCAVRLFEGSVNNFKITYPLDVDLAAVVLNHTNPLSCNHS